MKGEVGLECGRVEEGVVEWNKVDRCLNEWIREGVDWGVTGRVKATDKKITRTTKTSKMA